MGKAFAGVVALNDRGEHVVLQHPREPVARQQEHVARPHHAGEQVGRHVAAGAHAAGDHVGIGVGARLLGREVAGVHLLLHVGVVLGDLVEDPIPHQVAAAVPDLAEQVAVGVQHQHGGRAR